MAFASIAETGAKPGDTVKCITVTQPGLEGIRYVPGNIYTVHEWMGKPAVHGQSHGKVVAGNNTRWLIPFEGFGATWELVA